MEIKLMIQQLADKSALHLTASELELLSEQMPQVIKLIDTLADIPLHNCATNHPQDAVSYLTLRADAVKTAKGGEPL